MVDFGKLKTKQKNHQVLDPLEIFRRLPKPPGINDLYTSQADVLTRWFSQRAEHRDIVLKLHTGGGKTLVGLLAAQSTLNELSEPVIYLTPTQQLVNQTLEKAKAHGIPAVPYQRGQPLSDDFMNAKAVMIATYKALFNGRSKFGVRGQGHPLQASAVILDDAHVAVSVVRDSFTLEVRANANRDRYESLTELFRRAFKEIDRLGTFDDVVTGADNAILEVPYWAWHEQLDTVREQLKADADDHALVWPLLRDNLHLCHAIVSHTAFTITAILPFVNSFPTFAEAPRRIYMSATISDDSEIVRTFDANPDAVGQSLTSRSLAGVSERMILIPNLMPFRFEVRDATKTLAAWAATKRSVGTIILAPSDKAAATWSDTATVAKGSAEVEPLVGALQSGSTFGPAVFANRYDGIDLPGDSCRLLIMDGLPLGTSDYERFRAGSLYGGTTIARMLAQRIEQGIGRGARGSGDHCVILLIGRDLAAWVAKEGNYRFLTDATRAQLEMGTDVSKEVQDLRDLAHTIDRSLGRDREWITYHAETLAELVERDGADATAAVQAAIERQALRLWSEGYPDKAVARIDKFLGECKNLDPQSRGWMEQLGARIAHKWGHTDRAKDLQREAYSHNKNLVRPTTRPPYRRLDRPGSQEEFIVRKIGEYRQRRGALSEFEEAVAFLTRDSSANRFEQALADLGEWIGFATERFDRQGYGPDVLWLLPSKTGLVIEAKSRKRKDSAFTKKDHGQLLVSAEWFRRNYHGYECVRVSVHPTNRARGVAMAGDSYALTYEKLAAVVSDTRALLTNLCETQLSMEELKRECSHVLGESPLRGDRIVDAYFLRFRDLEDGTGGSDGGAATEGAATQTG